ncbi:MAG: hypothetical protein KDI13_03595 [Alphaproteobacteria bacterium]|nr:hypothetical protein [Alphaproteobacteria bacterium]
MFNKTKFSYYRFGAALTAGALIGSTGSAHAMNNFGSIAANITTGMSTLPGLITALSYMFGVLLAVLGVMKIKDHVENPTQTPLKDGAIRLAVGGALFALPIITEAMGDLIDTGFAQGTAVMGRSLNSVSFSTL